MSGCTMCGAPVRARGLCKRHYQQQWRTGDATISRPNPHGTPEERFWSKVDKRGPDDCWLWTGHRDKDGYGTLRVGTTQVRAARFSYELGGDVLGGDVLGDRMVRHSCDNPPCVNPAHLSPGTHIENMADRKAAGHYPRRNAA